MKKIAKTVVTFLAVLGSYSSFAQASATAAAAVTIVTPISMSKVTDMNFGNVAVSASAGGIVVLSTSSTRTTGGAGGATLPATSGTVAAAEFTVSGQSAYTYVITLPSSCVITDGGGHNMTVNSFTSTPTSTGALSSGGNQTLKVSATMIVSAGQPAGTYTNASGVPVTVNYN